LKNINSKRGKSPLGAEYLEENAEVDNLNNSEENESSDRSKLLKGDDQYEPRSRSTFRQRLTHKSKVLAYACKNKIGNSYRAPFWNTHFLNHSLGSPEQIQGTIDLTSVKLQQNICTSCGPEVKGCTNDSFDANSIKECPTTNTFRGVFTFQGPNKETKMVLVNYPKTPKEIDAQLVANLLKEIDPESEPMRTRNMKEVMAIQNCHYLMIHQPNLTKKGSKVKHNPKVYTEPLLVLEQLFKPQLLKWKDKASADNKIQ